MLVNSKSEKYEKHIFELSYRRQLVYGSTTLVAEVSMNSDSRILRGELEFFPDKLVVDLTIYQLLGIPFFRFLFINVVFLKNY